MLPMCGIEIEKMREREREKMILHSLCVCEREIVINETTWTGSSITWVRWPQCDRILC